MAAMSSRVASFYVVVILALDTILQVKGQPTVQVCENEDSSMRGEEFNVEAIRHLSGQINDMHEQTKAQQDNILRSLEAVDRRLNEHDIISIKSQTQNSRKLSVGQPVHLEIGLDYGEGPVLLPIVNNWIVFLNRFDGSLDFNRTWSEYRNGFGDLGRGEFWLGNEKVYRLTSRIGVNYTLRVEMQLNATGQWFYADYSTFSLDSESKKYAINLSGYSGNAGDSLSNTSLPTFHRHNGRSFTTKDADNDRYSLGNCAQNHGAGWWFDACYISCLTRRSFVWHVDEGWQTSGPLRTARMMIKSI